MNKFVIYRDVPVRIKQKMQHIRKIGGKLFNSIIDTFGDVPVLRLNRITGKFEPVVNTRGYGYAGRNRLQHRRKNTKGL